MLKKTLWIILLLTLASCSSVKKHNAGLGQDYSPEALQKDIDFTYKKLQKLHPRLYQYISKPELDRKFDSLKKSIDRPMNAKELYTVLTPVVSEVRQGHISSYFPDRWFTKRERKVLQATKFDFFDMEMTYIDGGLFIARTTAKDSLLAKSQVVAIGMETTAALLKKYRKTFSSDGQNKTFQNKFIANNFGALYSKHEGFRDSISMILMRDDSVFVKQFKRYLKDSSGLKPPVLDASKTSKKTSLTKAEKKAKKVRQKQLKKRNKKLGYNKRRDQYTRNFKFLDSAANIGYFKIRSWSNGPYKDFYAESFAKLDSAKTEHLILDFRDNSGGRLDEIHNFYGYLTNTEYTLIEPMEVNSRLPTVKTIYPKYANFMHVLGQTALLPYYLFDNLTSIKNRNGRLEYRVKASRPTAPEQVNFKGKVYVLINGGSFSATSLLAGKLHAMERATFIGEETGGAYNGTVAGQFKYISLPNSKVRFRLGLMQVETEHRQEPDGFGVEPDFTVLPTAADFINGRDPELEKALEIIKQKEQ